MLPYGLALAPRLAGSSILITIFIVVDVPALWFWVSWFVHRTETCQELNFATEMFSRGWIFLMIVRLTSGALSKISDVGYIIIIFSTVICVRLRMNDFGDHLTFKSSSGLVHEKTCFKSYSNDGFNSFLKQVFHHLFSCGRQAFRTFPTGPEAVFCIFRKPFSELWSTFHGSILEFVVFVDHLRIIFVLLQNPVT